MSRHPEAKIVAGEGAAAPLWGGRSLVRVSEQTPDPESSTSTSAEPLPSPGRAFVVYTALRLLVLLVSFVVLRLVLGPDNPLLVVGGAVLLSALLSLVLLRSQRDAFTSASIAKADRRRAERAARQARLDEGRSPEA